jgi:mono/diheme cytochrome c family protein
MDRTRGIRLASAAIAGIAIAWTSIVLAASAIDGGARNAPPPAAANQPVAPAGARLAQNSMPKVSYSSEQANRGKEDYEDHCLDCHGEDLRGGLLGGPPLRGLGFEQDFGGAPASSLFLFASTQMPPDAPGRLSPGTYADLVAYILKQNGYPAGAELPSDVDALDNLIVEK